MEHTEQLTPTDPTQYDVLPRQWKMVQHPVFGEVVAAMLPYPTLDDGALCAGDEHWTEQNGKRLYPPDVRYMRSLCGRCPLLVACREYGIAHELYGMWGGLLPAERAEVRKQRRQICVEPQAAHEYGLTDDYFAFLTPDPNTDRGEGGRFVATSATDRAQGSGETAERTG